jgi:Na+/H+-dicarboxylate symporter
MIKKIISSLLFKVVVAIFAGLLLSGIMPSGMARVFLTFNSIFGNYLGFIIPLIIIGLVTPGIAEIGKGAGKILAVTVGIAYLSTMLSGLFSYFTTCEFVPVLLGDGASGYSNFQSSGGVKEFFTIEMPPVASVTTAIVLSFVLGLGISASGSDKIKGIFIEFRNIIGILISKSIIPLLPLFIFGIFLKIGIDGQAVLILGTFVKIIALIFAMHIMLLLTQYIVAGLIARRNPFKALVKMLPAYFTALGTQSSAATIPVTLAQAKKNGVNSGIADFVIPLCATIHLSGSMLKIVSTAVTVMFLMHMDYSFGIFIGFMFMLAITMVAAPGVPGGAIMAAIAILQSMLGFNSEQIGLMIALYITMDSFGTAANVTGDGAIALIINKLYGHKTSA